MHVWSPIECLVFIYARHNSDKLIDQDSITKLKVNKFHQLTQSFKKSVQSKTVHSSVAQGDKIHDAHQLHFSNPTQNKDERDALWA